MRYPLRNKKVLLTAGPTREYWDPVRYLTNASSGAMGLALAAEARRLGAKVTLVLGPINQSLVRSSQFVVKPGTRNPELRTGVKVVPVVSGWDMYEAVKKHLPGTDIFIGAAAVVDYRPAAPLKRKFKRRRPSIHLRLYGNPDIIAMVGHLSSRRPRWVVGFALETDHLLENAHGKLRRKRLDWIVANRTSNMGESKGAAVLLSRWGDRISLKTMSKARLAQKIWDALLKTWTT